MNDFNNKPLITIMISYYNDNKFLKENIESILNQTYQNWELILLNHASTDNSREIAHSYSDKRISYIDYPVNLGAMSGELYYQMFKHANGKYVKFLSADDKLKTKGIEILVDYMEQHPEKGFAFGNVEYINAESKSLNDTWFNSRPLFSLDYNREQLLDIYFNVKASIFPFAGHIIRKDVLSKSNFDNAFILLFDVYLWFSLMVRYGTPGLINELVSCYRIHEGQLTSLSKAKVSSIRMNYEIEYYRKLICDISDIETVKIVCADSEYINKTDDPKDIKFILSEYLLNKYYSITGYNILKDLLNDEQTMLYLRQKFNFTIDTLRTLYSRYDYRKKALEIGSNLTYFQLIYLILFKLKTKIVTLFKKKEYSL